mmetsp:Transcript_24010/g.31272  ORF Transcript_24010/g.31272 Transcript_24010/m.31272 type:complete len:175 (+) Transcript_24010:86-610(+)|eukprot:CAMPEP_0195267190 /NCGR_PEP_ID=MMETSP0706-20130129/12443_1 /TAXON_ID=33640 /ORGANISM="Asterionellopsis glacialis, Strain CCMP134" /LENGTH=174 /DNA_ID=CAMNT_0040321895 /DNA_START=61 /DNA_END=585 /DNA_ORIENTATION=+
MISFHKLKVAVAVVCLLSVHTTSVVAENNDTRSNDNDAGSSAQNTCAYISMDGECMASGVASPNMAPTPVVADDVPTAGMGVASLAEPVVGPTVPSPAPTPRGLFGRFRKKKDDRDDNVTLQAPKPTAKPNRKKPASASAPAESDDESEGSEGSEGKKGKKGKKDDKDGKKHKH